MAGACLRIRHTPLVLRNVRLRRMSIVTTFLHVDDHQLHARTSCGKTSYVREGTRTNNPKINQ